MTPERLEQIKAENKHRENNEFESVRYLGSKGIAELIAAYEEMEKKYSIALDAFAEAALYIVENDV